jgi:hypothetical protein
MKKYCACSQNIIHDLLVVLLEQDIPTNYEENVVDLNAKMGKKTQKTNIVRVPPQRCA